jgi:hypothetical protein
MTSSFIFYSNTSTNDNNLDKYDDNDNDRLVMINNKSTDNYARKTDTNNKCLKFNN